MSNSVDYNLLLEWFEKEGDKFIGEEKLKLLTAEEACNLIGLNPDDHPLMKGCYKISDNEKNIFQKFVKHKFDFYKHQYFIGCYSKNQCFWDSQTTVPIGPQLRKRQFRAIGGKFR
jgi:hypothetical protein